MNSGTVNPLQQLKERLQTVLDESTESDCYQEAISDCAYACNLSVTALEQHMEKWLNGPYNYEYCKGIRFVENEWHKITGMF